MADWTIAVIHSGQRATLSGLRATSNIAELRASARAVLKTKGDAELQLLAGACDSNYRRAVAPSSGARE